MSTGLTRLLFFALLLVMPLQGIAAAIGTMVCLTGGHADFHAVGHAHHVHDSGMHPTYAGGSTHDDYSDQRGSSDYAGHLCCQLTAPALPPSVAVLPRPDLPHFQATLSLLSSLYIPERPQRPPRA